MNTSTKPAGPITAKNFAAKFGGFLKTANTQRDQLQAFVVFAVEHYASVDKNGDPVADSCYLTKILKDSVAVRSFATGTLQAYIQAHTNLVWTSPKDGEPAFRKVAKSELKADLDTIRSTVWYLHNEEGQAKPVFQAESYAKRVAAKLKKEGLSLAEFTALLEGAQK